MILGRGTATSEGLAIARSVLEYLHNNIGNIIDTTCNGIIDYNIYVYVGCRTLLATHFHELTNLSVELSNIGCYQVVAYKNNNDLIMTHKVEVITIYQLIVIYPFIIASTFYILILFIHFHYYRNYVSIFNPICSFIHPFINIIHPFSLDIPNHHLV